MGRSFTDTLAFDLGSTHMLNLVRKDELIGRV